MLWVGKPLEHPWLSHTGSEFRLTDSLHDLQETGVKGIGLSRSLQQAGVSLLLGACFPKPILVCTTRDCAIKMLSIFISEK